MLINLRRFFRALSKLVMTLSRESRLLFLIKLPSITMLADLGFPNFSAILLAGTRIISMSFLVTSFSTSDELIKRIPPD